MTSTTPMSKISKARLSMRNAQCAALPALSTAQFTALKGIVSLGFRFADYEVLLTDLVEHPLSETEDVIDTGDEQLAPITINLYSLTKDKEQQTRYKIPSTVIASLAAVIADFGQALAIAEKDVAPLVKGEGKRDVAFIHGAPVVNSAPRLVIADLYQQLSDHQKQANALSVPTPDGRFISSLGDWAIIGLNSKLGKQAVKLLCHHREHDKVKTNVLNAGFMIQREGSRPRTLSKESGGKKSEDSNTNTGGDADDGANAGPK